MFRVQHHRAYDHFEILRANPNFTEYTTHTVCSMRLHSRNGRVAPCAVRGDSIRKGLIIIVYRRQLGCLQILIVLSYCRVGESPAANAGGGAASLVLLVDVY